MRTVSATVVGRVQGVGFRAFVVREAREFGLRGEVWNAADGSVRAILQGAPESVDRVLEALRHGPGRVDRVLAEELAGPPSYESFSVSRTRTG